MPASVEVAHAHGAADGVGEALVELEAQDLQSERERCRVVAPGVPCARACAWWCARACLRRGRGWAVRACPWASMVRLRDGLGGSGRPNMSRSTVGARTVAGDGFAAVVAFSVGDFAAALGAAAAVWAAAVWAAAAPWSSAWCAWCRRIASRVT